MFKGLNPMFRLLPMIALATLSGCGDDDLPDYFLLDRLRVLAANTSGAAAEFSAGAAVTVDFHVSDPTGAGRTLSYSLVGCVDPGVGQGATPSCEGNPTATTLVSGGSFVSGSAATNYYGVLTSPGFNLPAAGVMFADPRTGSPRTAADQANGVAYLLVLELVASPTEKTVAFKRVIASTKATKNQNPAWGGSPVLYDGVAPGSYTLTTERFPVTAQVPAGSAESYARSAADGSTSVETEELTITWLVSAGEIRYSRTEIGTANRYTPANPLPARTSLIAVLRDDRGGTAVVDFHQ